MSAVGIDFGNDTSIVAVARAGGIETVINDYSQRATPTYVAFGPTCRDLGTSAKNKVITNLKNTFWNFKRLIGKQFHDTRFQREISYLPFTIHEMPNGNVGCKASYLGNETVFTIHQISAMLLTKLKNITETAFRSKVVDCVVSVPIYFSDAERRAMLDVCRIANLNVLRLLNETTAVALAYGFYRQDLSDSKPKKVMFIDVGHTALQASICEFYQGKLKVLISSWDVCVGGRDVDTFLVRHFSQEFKAKYNLEVLSNSRAVVRLLQECEKLKKQLSANPQALPLNIECFMDDKDVSSSLGREKLEELCAEIFVRIEKVLSSLLNELNLSPSDIHSVELIGGTSRMPAIRNIVKRIMKQEPSTTLNMDEAVARGCALQAAMLSPNVKVRDFSICDVQPYAIKLLWNLSKTERGDIEAFSRNEAIPFSKLFTFFRKEDFTLNAFYSFENDNDIFVGSFTIKNVNQVSTSESAKVIVKIRIDIHGIFNVCSAFIADKDSKDGPNLDQKAEDLTDLKRNSNLPPEPVVNEEKKNFFSLKKHKKVSQEIELLIEPKVPLLSENELKSYLEMEQKMIYQDNCEEKRINAKNSVEEFVYEMRNRLTEELKQFIDRQECDDFLHKLNQTEEWIYDDGENQNEDVYRERLTELQTMAHPIFRRKYEFDHRPTVITEFQNIIEEARNILNIYLSGDQQYSHIDSREMEQVQRVVDEKQNWFLQQKKILEELKTYENPPILLEQIAQVKEQLKQEIFPILNKPRPAVVEPPESQTEEPQNSS